MRPPVPIGLLSALFLLPWTPGFGQSLNGDAAPACTDSAPAFRRIIEEFQSRQKNVAISVGIMRDGQIVFLEASGLADREAGVVATPATRFGIASMTKAFTGAALLTLAAEGRIDLDAEIQQYVPEFPRHPAGPVTLRMLAAHVGGIRHWGRERNAELYARHIEDVMDILPLFKDDAFVVAPRTRYSYSSYGYNLLAMAIQRASGVSFQQYMRDEVLKPLRLTTVAFDYPGLDGASRPARYSWYDLTDYHDLDSAPVRVPDWDYSHNMGGGNMVAAVSDLLRFGRALRGPGFFSETTLKEVWQRPVIDTITTVMSFGWFVRRNPDRLSIGGSNAGLQSGLSVWKDEDFVVAALANSWGVGSRSGEFMDDGTRGLLGRLASVCGVKTEAPTP